MAGIVTTILTLPLAPVRVLTSVAKVLRDEAERELYDPGVLRRELEELDEAHDAGEISDDDYERTQQGILDRLIDQRGPRQ